MVLIWCVRLCCNITDHVEVTDMKVSVCRDAVKGRCGRGLCKYYHLPVSLPPAPLHPPSARTHHTTPRHHPLHPPPTHPLLDTTRYLENNNNSSNITNITTANANTSQLPLPPLPATASSNTSSGTAASSALHVIASLTSHNNIICN